MIKIFNKKFKNPLKKGQEIAIVSNDKIKDEYRLIQAKALLEKHEHTQQDSNPSSDEDFDNDEEFERDEDLSRSETIDPIKLNKRRLDSLQQIYAELDKQDKEQTLKLKILKKKATIERKKELYQTVMEIQAEQDKYYEEPKNEEGYYVLKEEKWNNEYDELLIQLARATDEDQRKTFNKQLKKLEGIRSKNKTKNRMNRIIRGINKTSQKIGQITRGVGKFADEIGQMGGQMGNVGQSNRSSSRKRTGKKRASGKSEFDSFEDFFKNKPSGKGGSKGVDWNNFFQDKPKTIAKADRKQRKTKKKKKKSKKKKRTTKSKSKQVVVSQQPPKQNWDNFFG